MKSLKLHIFVIGFMLLALCLQARAGIPLPFGQVTTGTIAAGSTVLYTFSANAGDVVDFTMTTTSGSVIPKIQLYNPSNSLIASNYSNSPFGCSGSTVELNTALLAAPGNYTVIVSDCSNANAGNYDLYLQRLNNPSGAATLPFSQTTPGTIGSAAGSSTFTFSANGGDTVDFTMTTTTGNLIPKIRLYNGVTGTLVKSNYSNSPFGCSGSTVEMNTVPIPSTGSYTVLIGDCGDTNEGNFEIYAQRTDAPTNPTPLLFGQTQTGTIALSAQSNSYTFSGNANDLIDFTMVSTSNNLIPKLRLYSEATGLLVSSNYSNSPFGCSGTVVEMNTVALPALPATGTYTLLVGDCNDTNTGNYSIYSQRTNNPSGASALLFNQAAAGLIGSAAENNTYTFNASANDLIDFTMTTTSGALIPRIRLYSPTGTLVSSNYSNSPFGCAGSYVEMNTVKILSAGTYTVLVGDCNDTSLGNYELYSQRTNNPSGASTLVLGGQIQAGSIGTAAQDSTYTFGANANATLVNLIMTTTKGTLIPRIRLYNPDGTLNSSNYANSPFGCSGTTVEMSSIALTQSGTYTVLVGDCSDTNTGNFNLSGQCIGCVTTPTITWPNPAPITTFTPLSGTQLDAVASVAGSYAYSFVCPLFSGPAIIGTELPVGSCTLSVVFTPTDTTDYTKATASVPITVTQAAPTITWPPPAPITYGTALSAAQLDATASFNGSPVAGTFAYSYTCPGSGGAATIGTVMTPGLCGLSTNFTPTDSTDFANASSSVVQIVDPATPNCVWPTPAPITNPAPLTGVQLDASCSWVVGGVTVPVFGNFSYSYGLVSIAAGTVLPVGNDKLSYTFTPTNTTNPGYYSMTNLATGSVILTVNPAAGTPVITWPALAPITFGTALSAAQLDATAALNGTAVAGTFAYSYNCPTGSATATIGTVLPAGVCILSASFTPTNPAYTTPAPYPNPLTVNQGTPQITWPAPAAITSTTPLSATQLDAAAFWAVAAKKVAVLGNYAYSYVCPSGSGAATIGTLLPAGSCTLTVNFTPTDTVDYTAAVRTDAITVTSATSFSLVPSPGALSVVQGSSITDTITIIPASGFTGSVTLAASGLPSGVTASFGTNPATSSSVLTLTATGTATVGGPVMVTITGTSGSLTSSTTIALTVTSLTVLSPGIAPAAGTYPAAQLVTLTDGTPGSTIYYTTNGSIPSPGAAGTTGYTVPFLVSTNETVNAIAVVLTTTSPTASAAYTFIGSPSALAEPATAISTPTATLNALVNTNGLVGSYYFQYGTSIAALTTTTPPTALPASAVPVTVSAPIAGLVKGTTYYYQVVVNTAGGTSWGAVLNFTAN